MHVQCRALEDMKWDVVWWRDGHILIEGQEKQTNRNSLNRRRAFMTLEQERRANA